MNESIFSIFIILLLLKLTGLIICSWWIVFAPFWLPILLGLILGILNEL
jgi:hypothetical protein